MCQLTPSCEPKLEPEAKEKESAPYLRKAQRQVWVIFQGKVDSSEGATRVSALSP